MSNRTSDDIAREADEIVRRAQEKNGTTPKKEHCSTCTHWCVCSPYIRATPCS